MAGWLAGWKAGRQRVVNGEAALGDEDGRRKKNKGLALPLGT
jgi:hypothetical protein